MDDKCDLLRGIREEKVPSKAKRGECTRPSGNGVVSFSPPRWREMKTRFLPSRGSRRIFDGGDRSNAFPRTAIP